MPREKVRLSQYLIEKIRAKQFELYGNTTLTRLSQHLYNDRQQNVFDAMAGELVSSNWADDLCVFLGYKDFKTADAYARSEEAFLQNLEGVWGGFRLNKERKLCIGKLELIPMDGQMNQRKGLDAKLVDSDGNNYQGEMYFSFHSSGLLTMNLTSGEAEYLTYSAFVDIETNPEAIVFNVLRKKGERVESSQEVIGRDQSLSDFSLPKKFNRTPFLRENQSPQTIEKRGYFSIGSDLNFSYLMHHYLSTYTIKTKVPFKALLMENPLESYRHEIFISSPIRSLIDDHGRHDDLVKQVSVVKKVVEVLRKKLGFRKDNIFCESQHLNVVEKDGKTVVVDNAGNEVNNDLWKRSDYVFDQAKEHIRATHFIALIPKNASLKRNSGIFFEIYYRIALKLPIYVFHEDYAFPTLVEGLIHNKDPQRNLQFEACSMDGVPGFIEQFSLSVFDFS